MKKLLLITLFVCSMGTFTACGSENPEFENENLQTTTSETESPKTTTPENENSQTTISETVEGNTSEKETEVIIDKEEIQEETSSESIEMVEEQSQVVERPQILSLQEMRKGKYEGIGDYEKLLMISEFNYITFWEGTETYPKMAHMMSEIADRIMRSTEELADDMVSFAQEIFDVNGGNFETQISTAEEQVRRADGVVVSCLTDSYANYGFIRGVRGMVGSNYDTQTGQQLALTDVIKDMTQIPALVEKELNTHLMPGDSYSETAIQNYFQNTPEDGINWTLDYNGVTFYFGDGDLTEPGNGRQTATISFAEYPELFEEKYMNVPDAYMVRLSLDSSFFTDLDGDGTLEALNVTGLYNEEERFYSEFGISIDTDGAYYYEDFFAYGYNPYYVKTADGKHYLYLFCEENEADNRQMMLVVFDISGGQLTRVGEMNVAPAYIPSDSFILPLNPNYMLLDNFDSQEQDFGIYMVGENGMPVKK